LVEYKDYWDPTLFNRKDFWWFKEVTRGNVDNLTLETDETNVPTVVENLDFSVDRFMITVESESNSAEMPMVLFDASLKGTAHNWTGKLSVDARMDFQMSYYNEAFNVWEPVIEPLQSECGKWDRWQLCAKVQILVFHPAICV
jgi:hypothetical protein